MSRFHVPLALALLALAACGDGTPRDKAAAPAEPSPGHASDAVAESLLRALETRPVKGAQLVARPAVAQFKLGPGSQAAETVRLTNEGDAPASVQSAVATARQRGLALDGSCMAFPTLAPGQTCDLEIRYSETSGRDLDASVLITSDAKLSPQITIGLSVNVLQPKVAEEPAPPRAEPPQPTSPRMTYDPALARAIARANAQRLRGSFGQAGPQDEAALHIRPEIVKKDRDTRYDPDIVPWTEASLAVDRSRTLTVDRVIKAVLETPITNVMCNQAIAQVESNVFSPDNVNVLIPAGTKVIGRCQAFADERVNIQWERMITPLGVSISFRSLMGDTADAMGRGGVPGSVEESVFGRYVAPGLTTTIDTLGALATALYGSDQTTTYDPNSGRETTVQSAKDRAIEDFNTTARETVKKVIQDIAESRRIVLVPGGTRLDLILQEDIYFKSPYEVVRLADVEYDIVRPVKGPAIVEQSAPAYEIVPQVNAGKRHDADTVTINGRTYVLQPAPAVPAGVRGQAPPRTPSRRSNAPPERLPTPEGEFATEPEVAPATPARPRTSISNSAGAR